MEHIPLSDSTPDVSPQAQFAADVEELLVHADKVDVNRSNQAITIRMELPGERLEAAQAAQREFEKPELTAAAAGKVMPALLGRRSKIDKYLAGADLHGLFFVTLSTTETRTVYGVLLNGAQRAKKLRRVELGPPVAPPAVEEGGTDDRDAHSTQGLERFRRLGYVVVGAIRPGLHHKRVSKKEAAYLHCLLTYGTADRH